MAIIRPEPEMKPQRREELEKAYLATYYRIIPWKLTLKVNAFHPALDEILKASEHAHWAFITACNPKSNPLPQEENLQRMVAFRHSLSNRPFFKAVGEPMLNDWEPEPSFFIPGMTEAEARAVGREYEQWAVLTGQIGQKAKLSWCFET